MQDNVSAVVMYESVRSKCIEACSVERLEQLSNSIDNLDPYSDERDAFATIILGGSIKLSFDSEGRVVLPEALIKFADLSGEACFVGKGKTFEIWNPKEYEKYYLKAKEMAMLNRDALKLNKIKL
jgi:MraZ protein